jgi:hypothetical protein
MTPTNLKSVPSIIEAQSQDTIAEQTKLIAAGKAINWPLASRISRLTESMISEPSTRWQTFEAAERLIINAISNRATSFPKRHALQGKWNLFIKALKNNEASNSEQKIGNEDAAQMAAELKENKTLTTPDLGCNKIGDAGIVQEVEMDVVSDAFDPPQYSHGLGADRDLNSSDLSLEDNDEELARALSLSLSENQKQPNQSTEITRFLSRTFRPMKKASLKTKKMPFIKAVEVCREINPMLSPETGQKIHSAMLLMTPKGKNLTEVTLLHLPPDILIQIFSRIQFYQLCNFTPCKGWKEITRALVFNHSNLKLLSIAQKYLHGGNRKGADFYASALPKDEGQTYKNDVKAMFMKHLESQYLCVKTTTLPSRFHLAITASTINEIGKDYLPDYLDFLSSHEEYSSFFSHPQPHAELAHLCYRLLRSFAQTDLDLNSRCMIDCANFCFINSDRAKAFVKAEIHNFKYSEYQHILRRIASIPNLPPKVSSNVNEMRKLFLSFQGNQTLKPNERFSRGASEILRREPLKELILLANKFPEERNIHYPLIAKFIISSAIEIFSKDDIACILSVVEALKGDKTLRDKDMTCIELLNQCMKIENQCMERETRNDSFTFDWGAHELQIAIITSLLDEHHQNITNFNKQY